MLPSVFGDNSLIPDNDMNPGCVAEMDASIAEQILRRAVRRSIPAPISGMDIPNVVDGPDHQAAVKMASLLYTPGNPKDALAWADIAFPTDALQNDAAWYAWKRRAIVAWLMAPPHVLVENLAMFNALYNQAKAECDAAFRKAKERGDKTQSELLDEQRKCYAKNLAYPPQELLAAALMAMSGLVTSSSPHHACLLCWLFGQDGGYFYRQQSNGAKIFYEEIMGHEYVNPNIKTLCGHHDIEPSSCHERIAFWEEQYRKNPELAGRIQAFHKRRSQEKFSADASRKVSRYKTILPDDDYVHYMHEAGAMATSWGSYVARKWQEYMDGTWEEDDKIAAFYNKQFKKDKTLTSLFGDEADEQLRPLFQFLTPLFDIRYGNADKAKSAWEALSPAQKQVAMTVAWQRWYDGSTKNRIILETGKGRKMTSYNAPTNWVWRKKLTTNEHQICCQVSDAPPPLLLPAPLDGTDRPPRMQFPYRAVYVGDGAETADFIQRWIAYGERSLAIGLHGLTTLDDAVRHNKMVREVMFTPDETGTSPMEQLAYQVRAGGLLSWLLDATLFAKMYDDYKKYLHQSHEQKDGYFHRNTTQHNEQALSDLLSVFLDSRLAPKIRYRIMHSTARNHWDGFPAPPDREDDVLRSGLAASVIYTLKHGSLCDCDDPASLTVAAQTAALLGIVEQAALGYPRTYYALLTRLQDKEHRDVVMLTARHVWTIALSKAANGEDHTNITALLEGRIDPNAVASLSQNELPHALKLKLAEAETYLPLSQRRHFTATKLKRGFLPEEYVGALAQLGRDGGLAMLALADEHSPQRADYTETKGLLKQRLKDTRDTLDDMKDRLEYYEGDVSDEMKQQAEALTVQFAQHLAAIFALASHELGQSLRDVHSDKDGVLDEDIYTSLLQVAQQTRVWQKLGNKVTQSVGLLAFAGDALKWARKALPDEVRDKLPGDAHEIEQFLRYARLAERSDFPKVHQYLSEKVSDLRDAILPLDVPDDVKAVALYRYAAVLPNVYYDELMDAIKSLPDLTPTMRAVLFGAGVDDDVVDTYQMPALIQA